MKEEFDWKTINDIMKNRSSDLGRILLWAPVRERYKKFIPYVYDPKNNTWYGITTSKSRYIITSEPGDMDIWKVRKDFPTLALESLLIAKLKRRKRHIEERDKPKTTIKERKKHPSLF
ncbi:MAG: hypothetical protein KAX05_16880 [Bacteroidales bacterium]|nr:hypothetical protein [Bacteroidales bacterium]